MRCRQQTGFYTLALILGFCFNLITGPVFAFWPHHKTPDPEKQIQKNYQSVSVQQWQSLKQPVDTETPPDLDVQYPNTQWWTLFADTTLNALVEKALAANPSLEGYRLRIQESQALAKVNASVLFPTVDAGASYLFQQYSQNQFLFPLQGRTYHSFQTPVTVNYEVDIWGKNLDAVKMSRLGISVAKYDFANAQTQLAAAVVGAYINLAKLSAMTDSQTHLVNDWQQLLNHNNQLFLFGQIPSSNVDAIQQQLQATQADLTQFKGNQQLAVQQLTTLLGSSATTTEDIPHQSLNAMSIPESLATGVPSELLVHRPDIARVEANLHMARLNERIARKSLLPTIKITGGSGFNAYGIRKLFRVDSLNSLISPSISQPIFRGGLLSAGIKYRKTQYRILLTDYQNTILNAFLEVENALTLWQANRSILMDVTHQLEAVNRQAEHAQQRVAIGLDGEPAWLVVDAQRLSFEKAQMQQKAQLLMDTVSVMKALGGGFEQSRM